MLFTGLQKVSLVDFDTELSTTIFTGGCNFRCPFCHNFEFVIFDKENLPTIKDEEIFKYLESRKGLLSAVAITGGEPTIHKDLRDYLVRIKSMGFKIKLDTNGTNPKDVIGFIEDGLIDYVAIDIKNSKELYKKTIGLESFDLTNLETMIDYLKSHDFPYEFRTTLIDNFHSEESIEEMGKWLNGSKKHVFQKFVLSDNVPDRSLRPVSDEKVIEYKKILEKYIPNVKLRGYN